MDIKQKNFLRPGFYRFGTKVVQMTADDLKQLRNKTNSMLKRDVAVPMLNGHAPPGSVGPGDRKATDNCGWLKHVTQEPDGSLSLVGNVTKKEIADAIKEGTIRFTSPEIGHYVDGANRDHGTVIRHMALTPAPRNPDQEDIMCLQLSEDEMVDGKVDEYVTFSEMEESMSTATIEPEVTQVDISEQMLALAADQGVVLPDGIDMSTPDGQLQYITACRNHKKGLDEGSADEGHEGLTKTEKKNLSHETGTPGGIMGQYSEEQNTRIKALEDELASSKNDTIRAGIAGRIEGAKIPPAMRKGLSARVENLQFSDKDQTVLSIPEVIDMVESCLPEFAQMSEATEKTVTVDGHPDGDNAFKTDGPGDVGEPTTEKMQNVASEFLGVKQA